MAAMHAAFRSQKLLLRCGWRAWCQAVHDKQQRRQAKQLAEQHCRRRLLALGWSGWLGWTALCRDAQRRQAARTQASVFKAWRSAAKAAEKRCGGLRCPCMPGLLTTPLCLPPIFIPPAQTSSVKCAALNPATLWDLLFPAGGWLNCSTGAANTADSVAPLLPGGSRPRRGGRGAASWPVRALCWRAACWAGSWRAGGGPRWRGSCTVRWRRYTRCRGLLSRRVSRRISKRSRWGTTGTKGEGLRAMPGPP